MTTNVVNPVNLSAALSAASRPHVALSREVPPRCPKHMILKSMRLGWRLRAMVVVWKCHVVSFDYTLYTPRIVLRVPRALTWGRQPKVVFILRLYRFANPKHAQNIV